MNDAHGVKDAGACRQAFCPGACLSAILLTRKNGFTAHRQPQIAP
jgi:hypothetical protein